MLTDTCAQTTLKEYEAIGCAVLNEYMEAFNTGDTRKWAAVLQFPHVRLAGEKVQVWRDTEEFIADPDNDLAHLARKINWGYNKWDWRHLVQFGPGKLHYAVRLSRYSVNDALITSFESLYIVTRLHERWGVQGRSTYGGIFSGNSGY